MKQGGGKHRKRQWKVTHSLERVGVTKTSNAYMPKIYKEPSAVDFVVYCLHPSGTWLSLFHLPRGMISDVSPGIAQPRLCVYITSVCMCDGWGSLNLMTSWWDLNHFRSPCLDFSLPLKSRPTPELTLGLAEASVAIFPSNRFCFFISIHVWTPSPSHSTTFPKNKQKKQKQKQKLTTPSKFLAHNLEETESKAGSEHATCATDETAITF